MNDDNAPLLSSTGFMDVPVVELVKQKKRKKKKRVVLVKKKHKKPIKIHKLKHKIRKPNAIALFFKRLKIVPKFKKLLAFLSSKGGVRNIYIIDFVLTLLLLNWWVVTISFTCFSPQVKMASSVLLMQIIVILGVITWMSTRKIK